MGYEQHKPPSGVPEGQHRGDQCDRHRRLTAPGPLHDPIGTFPLRLRQPGRQHPLKLQQTLRTSHQLLVLLIKYRVIRAALLDPRVPIPQIPDHGLMLLAQLTLALCHPVPLNHAW